MSTVRLSTLLQVLDVLARVEADLAPDSRNRLWFPVMAARTTLQNELGLGTVEVRADTPIPSTTGETPHGVQQARD